MVILACHSSKGHLCGPSASRTRTRAHWKCHHYHSRLCTSVCVCLSGCTLNHFIVFCSISSCFLHFPPSSVRCFFVFLLLLTTASPPPPPSALTRQAVNIYMYWNPTNRSLSISASHWRGSLTFPALSVIGSFSFFFQLIFIIYMISVSKNRCSDF